MVAPEFENGVAGHRCYNEMSQLMTVTDERSSNKQNHGRQQSHGRRRLRRWLVLGTRYVLPVTVSLGGAIVMAFGSESDLEGGAGIVSAGLAIYAINWLSRASIEGDRVRTEEEAARTYFSIHGRWPDE